ncbi:MAG TPA: hypothetical protein VK886_21525 [Vicinamibacterales bacterium]|nr:hypothetical protein [Vicinamibacterales bacterium]
MVPVLSLVVPILLAAVFAFVASSIIHMVLGYHRNDVRQVPKQDEVQEALRRFNLAPGDYILPHAGPRHNVKDPAFQERVKKGPLVVMTVMRDMGMGRSLALWFVNCLIVSIFAAYIAGRALGPGAHYLQVFRFAGATAFAGYSLALLQNSIWWRRSWSSTLLSMFDGLIYALLTGGTFGWLWPR